MHISTRILSPVEPHWIDLTRRRPAGVPDRFYRWIRDEGSLTRRVITTCPGRFRVRVLHQGWGSPLLGERSLLRTRRSEISIVREVELLCDESPWVFARTLIPASSLSGGARRLAQLGDKPLGAVLFADPATRRDTVQFARLMPRHPLFVAAADHLQTRPEELWARRTLFSFSGKPILVNEIFLPDISDF